MNRPSVIPLDACDGWWRCLRCQHAFECQAGWAICPFCRSRPVCGKDLLTLDWFAVPDEGRWYVVSGHPVPPSHILPFRQGCITEVASFTHRELAEHIVAVHNEWVAHERHYPDRYHAR